VDQRGDGVHVGLAAGSEISKADLQEWLINQLIAMGAATAASDPASAELVDRLGPTFFAQ